MVNEREGQFGGDWVTSSSKVSLLLDKGKTTALRKSQSGFGLFTEKGIPCPPPGSHLC